MPNLIEFECANCQGRFQYTRARYNKYLRTWGKNPLYCTRQCYWDARKKAGAQSAFFDCEECGQRTPMRRHEYIVQATGKRAVYYARDQRFCSRRCASKRARKEADDRFSKGTGNKNIDTNGYVRVALPAINGRTKSGYEHRIIMERILGRALLPGEQVHHRNGDKTDNLPENLELWARYQPTGTRVIDKIAFAIEMLRLYPDFAAEQGVKLVDVEHSD